MIPVDTDPWTVDKVETVRHKVKFEVFGEEMLDKLVKNSGDSGYLPSYWVGCRVKVVRTE